MTRALLIRYRRLIFASALFIVIFILYFFLRERLQSLWGITIQSEHITAKHLSETIVWITAWWLLISLIEVIVWDTIIKRTGNPIPQLLKSSMNLVVLLIIIICIVAFVYGKSITGLLATTGALGIVLGLSLRGVIENAVQGIALNIERPFKTGDLITIPGKIDELAVVKDITYRNTYIEDTYGHIIAVPNSVVCSNVVKNYSRSNSQLFSIVLNLSIGVRELHTESVIRILYAVIASHDFIANEPPPQVTITNIKSLELNYDISVWVYRSKSNPTDARHILYEKFIEQLSAAGFIVGRPFIDHDGIEQQMATILREMDTFENLSAKEKDEFYYKEMESKRAFRVLRQVSIFSNLNNDELLSLSKHINIINRKTNDTLIRQGDAGDIMYILVEGALQVFIDSPDGKELIPVAKLVPPQYFGEMSVLIGERRSATVISLSDVELYELTKETMSNLFETHPNMIEKISEKIIEQKIMNLQKIQEYSAREVISEKRKFVNEFVNKVKQFFTRKK